ncbi:MAG: HAD hydrolase-like protein, partial [Bacteroidaceae bacterium]|nr:HAD hydrolase-like protein [Bacteroidaceae bacterium]
MKKLVIFDLDGTLLNTIADLANATNYALAQLGFGMHPLDSYPTFVGNGIRKLFERALPPTRQSDEWVEKVRTLFMPYYDEHNADETLPYEGTVPLLEALHQQGILLAVASNKYQRATEKLIHHYFPNVPFVCILGQREGIPVKPHPGIVHTLLEKAGVSAAEALYVGDSGVD